MTIEIEDSDLKMYDKNDLTAIQFAQLYTIETLKKTNAEVKELKVSFKILQKVSSSLLKSNFFLICFLDLKTKFYIYKELKKLRNYLKPNQVQSKKADHLSLI